VLTLANGAGAALLGPAATADGDDPSTAAGPPSSARSPPPSGGARGAKQQGMLMGFRGSSCGGVGGPCLGCSSPLPAPPRTPPPPPPRAGGGASSPPPSPPPALCSSCRQGGLAAPAVLLKLLETERALERAATALAAARDRAAASATVGGRAREHASGDLAAPLANVLRRLAEARQARAADGGCATYFCSNILFSACLIRSSRLCLANDRVWFSL
jgi:hypothetical protein